MGRFENPRFLPGFRVMLGGAMLLLAAGCRQGDGNDLVLLTNGGPIRAAVDVAVAEFEREHPGVKVQVVSTPGKNYYVKSLTMLAGRAHVDVLWMGQGFGLFAGRGALLGLDAFIRDDPEFNLEAYHPEVVDWYRSKGALYGIPFGIDVMAIAYNQDVFAAAGEPCPKPGWTLEDMLEKAARLTQFDPGSGRIKTAGLGFSSLDYRYYGLSLLDDTHRRFALNTDEGREWMRRNVELIRGRILQKGGELESLDRLSPFLNGQVAMIAAATWDIQELHDRVPFRWDIVGIPTGKSGEPLAWASSSGFCIARNTKHPELAWELLKKLTGADFQRKILGSTIPAMKALHGEYLRAHPAPPGHLGELVGMVDHMRPNPRIAPFQEVEAEWMYWRDQALLEKIPPEKALREAESHINRILDLHAEGAEP